MARSSPKRKTGWPKYWNPKIETMPRKELQELQDRRIRHIVRYAWENSVFYRRIWKEHNPNLTPDDIRGWEDLKKLPIITKDDIRKVQGEAPPYGDMVGASTDLMVEWSCTTGTTGRPTYNIWTMGEQGYSINTTARSFYTGMCRPGDIFYNGWRLDWHNHWGPMAASAAFTIGMKPVPAGAGFIATQPDRVADYLKEVRPTVWCSLPTMAYNFGLTLKEKGIESPFEVIILAGEPGPACFPEIRKALQELHNCDYVIDFWATGETGTGFLVECEEMDGMHWWHDIAAFEIIDAETKERVGPGERGLLVFTSLFSKTIPYIRFNVEDYASYVEDICACGRTHYLFKGGIPGRAEWVVKVGRKYILPPDVEAKLRTEFPEVKEYQIVKETPLEMPYLKLRLEPRKEPKDPDSWAKEHEEKLTEKFGVPVKVEYLAPGTLGVPIFKKTYVVNLWKEKTQKQ